MHPQACVTKDMRAALSYVRYDRYLNGTPESFHDGTPESFHDGTPESFQDDSIPLSEYLKTKAMVANPPCNSKREGNMLLPGERFNRNWRASTEAGKKITRTMLKALWRNGRNNECFSDFDDSNIFVSSSGKVKFYLVERLAKDPIQTRRNYMSAHKIITNLFSKGGKIPQDINHLLNMIEYEHKKSELFHIHASLVPVCTMSLMYQKMYDHLTCKLPEIQRKKIFVKLPYIEDWKDKLMDNYLLMKTYDFKPGRYDLKLPPPGKPKLSAFEEKVFKAMSFLDYLRNRTVHRMDYVKEIAGYEAEGSELACHVRYPLIMCCLQDELFMIRALEILKLDECF